MTPDYCEALTGYRAWSVDERGYLASPVGPGWRWRPRRINRAVCRNNGHGRLHWSLESGEVIGAPVAGCSCGFYAYKSVDNANTYGAEVWGEVKLWGRIIEHDDGYRAEFAYPSLLKTADPRLAARLRFLYGVPCEVFVKALAPQVKAPTSPQTIPVQTFGQVQPTPTPSQPAVQPVMAVIQGRSRSIPHCVRPSKSLASVGIGIGLGIAVLCCIGALVGAAASATAASFPPDKPPMVIVAPQKKAPPPVAAVADERDAAHRMFLITFSPKSGDIAEILPDLQAIGSTRKIGDAWSWLLWTAYDPQDISDRLKSKADVMFAAEVFGPAKTHYQGWLNSDVWKWYNDRCDSRSCR